MLLLPILPSVLSLPSPCPAAAAAACTVAGQPAEAWLRPADCPRCSALLYRQAGLVCWGRQRRGELRAAGVYVLTGVHTRFGVEEMFAGVCVCWV